MTRWAFCDTSLRVLSQIFRQCLKIGIFYADHSRAPAEASHCLVRVGFGIGADTAHSGEAQGPVFGETGPYSMLNPEPLIAQSWQGDSAFVGPLKELKAQSG